jgi:hypothetical protein
VTNGLTDLMGANTCSYFCGGDSAENCGGPDATSIFQVNAAVIPVPGWVGFDCFTDSTVLGNVLTGPSETSPSMTPALCASFCAINGTSSYQFFGLEAGM